MRNRPGHRLTSLLTPRRYGPEFRFRDHETEALGEGRPLVFDRFLGRLGALACAAEARDVSDAGHLTPAGTGRGRRKVTDIRGDVTSWLGPEARPPALEALWRAFETLRTQLNTQIWMGLHAFDLQLARYPGSGTRYRAHRDSFRGRGSRRVTAICYLNPSWEPPHGGVLRCCVPEGDVDIEPRLDRLVIFLSEHLIHEVLPSHHDRFAVTAWYRGR